jgi:sugar phosphate isomerase/epimerase
MPTAKTLTGNYPIGYRWIGSAWQNDFDKTLEWTAANGFVSIDLPASHATQAVKLTKHGLKVVSIDLSGWGGYQALITADKAKRAEAIKKTTEVIQQGAEAGAKIFFTLMLPENPDLPRAENFKYTVEAYSQLAPVIEKANAKLVIEGWPGPGALCCTPETYRAFLKEVPSPAYGVNYDPSHLIRMGVDPMRFIAEFGKRVFHVHGKDTELNSENLYEFGSEQPGAFTPGQGFGGWAWRYTIPGHGQARWTAIFQQLVKDGFNGIVSIELEDLRFNGSEAGEKLGLVKGREYLEGC